MKALCTTPERTVILLDIPAPGDPPAGHVQIKMEGCAMNPGDKFFLKAPPGGVPRSQHDVWGASGAGTVLAVGAGVDTHWRGRRVAVYRSLWPSEHVLGTWCTTAQMPVRGCALIPEGLDAREYSGSLVNVITAYAFAKQATAEGHRGFLVTAGSSATGIALLGLARTWGIPVVSMVRDDAGRQELRALGAEQVVAQADGSFESDLRDAVERCRATAVFDGVGGALLTRIVPSLAPGSTIFTYGYLGGYDAPFQIPTRLLMAKSMTLRSFSNFASPTVRDPQQLDAALRDIGELLALPHCKTRLGRTFTFERIEDALTALGEEKGKPLLLPSEDE